MQKLLCLLLLIAGVGFAQDLKWTFRPEIAIGKDVNGNYALEVIPVKFSWEPVPEWNIKGWLSVNYTKPRSGDGAWDHYSQGILAKIEYKPFKFIEKMIPIGTLDDFTITFTKSFSTTYAGATNPVSYLQPQSNAWERISTGFNIEF